MKAGLTLTQLAAEIERQATEKHDLVAPASQVNVTVYDGTPRLNVGQEDAAEFLRGALEPVEHEQDTRHWYALRFGPADFAIFDTFPGNAGRLKHLFGTVGRALVVKTFTILNGLPEIEPADILALKVPAADALPRLALHVPLEARDGAEEEVARFLQGARSAVEREPGTLSWYALRLGKTRFAIVDTFADEAGREAHLSGEVGTALSGSSASLFAEPPQIHRAEILAFKIASAGDEERTSSNTSVTRPLERGTV